MCLAQELAKRKLGVISMNFVHKDTTISDREILFADWDNDLSNEIFIEIDDETTIEDIIVDHLKKFPSRSQARKNNWAGIIPIGFKQWKIGKIFFWTYKPIK
jgi:hypothetical protein